MQGRGGLTVEQVEKELSRVEVWLAGAVEYRDTARKVVQVLRARKLRIERKLARRKEWE